MIYNVVIIGGGIYGTGLLHDLATRHVENILLLEKGRLASATSSRSTKLMHGGLRYLEHITQWPLVYHALKERNLFLSLLPELVKPVPLTIPAYVSNKPAWTIPIGLFLYDTLSAHHKLPKAHRVDPKALKECFHSFKDDVFNTYFKKSYCYYDGQMVDDVLAKVSAFAATKQGAEYAEHASVTGIKKLKSGLYQVQYQQNGKEIEITSRVVTIAAGAWNNEILIKNKFIPKTGVFINAGSHILFSKEMFGKANFCDENHDAGIVLPYKGRLIFLLPWEGYWMLGTTEHPLTHIPEKSAPSEDEIKYLLEVMTEYFDIPDPKKFMVGSFMGMRSIPQPISSSCLPEDPFTEPYYLKTNVQNAIGLARETAVNEVDDNLFVIYGGKYTTYRVESEFLGSQISTRLGIGGPSQTQLRSFWHIDELMQEHPELLKTDHSLRLGHLQ